MAAVGVFTLTSGSLVVTDASYEYCTGTKRLVVFQQTPPTFFCNVRAIFIFSCRVWGAGRS